MSDENRVWRIVIYWNLMYNLSKRADGRRQRAKEKASRHSYWLSLFIIIICFSSAFSLLPSAT